MSVVGSQANGASEGFYGQRTIALTTKDYEKWQIQSLAHNPKSASHTRWTKMTGLYCCCIAAPHQPPIHQIMQSNGEIYESQCSRILSASEHLKHVTEAMDCLKWCSIPFQSSPRPLECFTNGTFEVSALWSRWSYLQFHFMYNHSIRNILQYRVSVGQRFEYWWHI